jgi:hypothetical protein
LEEEEEEELEALQEEVPVEGGDPLTKQAVVEL